MTTTPSPDIGRAAYARGVFGESSDHEREASTTAFVLSTMVAGIIHLGFAWVTSTLPPLAGPDLAKVTEIELAAPPEPTPPPPAEAPQAPPEAPPLPARGTNDVAPPRSTPAPAAARAGNVVTARADAPSAQAADAVDFVTDPEGKTFGLGYVARGGQADRGTAGAVAGPVAVESAPKPGSARGDDLAITAPENLSRAARLDETDPCRGRYPRDARADEGRATIVLVVRGDGSVARASVAAESPAGEGFGDAARACLAGKRFEPARDKSGTAVGARATVRVRFTR